MSKIVDLVGKEYGKLTVLEFSHIEKGSHWKCQCDCGNITVKKGSYLKGGDTKSCGCEAHKSGKDHQSWKGGRLKSSKGYIYIFQPNHPKANFGYIAEHVLVAEKEYGDFLPIGFSVHHINEIKNDNRPENLMIFKSESLHQRYHLDKKHLMNVDILDGENVGYVNDMMKRKI